mmetsp:Transcript_35348/g.60842  ORF Transcript_35348/g.60842 Transcript_35348/m.60842 type:complete len:207 (-) Transcript_35348:1116-1736(-)
MCFANLAPSPGYTASIASLRSYTPCNEGHASFIDSINESQAPTSSFIAAKRRMGACFFTSNLHGSISPMVLTVRETPSGAAELCPPHIHNTLSPRTLGTESCAPTSACLPTQISLASKLLRNSPDSTRTRCTSSLGRKSSNTAHPFFSKCSDAALAITLTCFFALDLLAFFLLFTLLSAVTPLNAAEASRALINSFSASATRVTSM